MAEDPNEKIYASECECKQIALYSIKDENKPYANLLGMAVTFQYHEDIFWPSYGATMTIVDNQENLISSMPIQGFEKVVVEFEDVVGETYSYAFRVWTVQNRITRERRNTYTLGLISEEGLRNEGVRINTIIEGNTSAQVKKLLSEYLKVPVGKIDAEKSATSIKILPTKKTPFSLIRSLQQKTVSERTGKIGAAKNSPDKGGAETSRTVTKTDVNPEIAAKATGTAGYLFFQTRKGHVFRSIDSLVSSDNEFNGKPPVNLEDPFFMQGAKSGEESRKRIQEIVFGNELNIMKKMREGAYSSLCCFFNINTHEYEEQVYRLSDMWKDMAHMGSQTKLGGGQEYLSKYPSRVMSTIVNHENHYMGSEVASNEDKHGGDGDNSYPDWQKQFLAQGISRLGILFNQELSISLTGHLELCAGDKVEVRIPNQKPDDELRAVWDPEHSGTYLIKNLNHQFNIPGKSVYTVLQLIRDSYGIKDQESNVK
jgi:hypothetical protein